MNKTQILRFSGLCLATFIAHGVWASSLTDAQIDLKTYYCRAIILGDTRETPVIVLEARNSSAAPATNSSDAATSETANTKPVVLPYPNREVPFKDPSTPPTYSPESRGYSPELCRDFLGEAEAKKLSMLSKDEKESAQFDYALFLADEIAGLDPLLYDHIMHDIAADYGNAATLLYPADPATIWGATHLLSGQIQSRLAPQIAAWQHDQDNPKLKHAEWFLDGAQWVGQYIGYTGMAWAVAKGSLKAAEIYALQKGAKQGTSWFASAGFKKASQSFFNFAFKRGNKVKPGAPTETTTAPSQTLLLAEKSADRFEFEDGPFQQRYTHVEKTLAAPMNSPEAKMRPLVPSSLRMMSRMVDDIGRMATYGLITRGMIDGMVNYHTHYISKYRNDPMKYLANVQSSLLYEQYNSAVVDYLVNAEAQLKNVQAKGLKNIPIEGLLAEQKKLQSYLHDAELGAKEIPVIFRGAIQSGGFNDEFKQTSLAISPLTVQNEMVERFQKSAALTQTLLDVFEEEIAKRPRPVQPATPAAPAKAAGAEKVEASEALLGPVSSGKEDAKAGSNVTTPAKTSETKAKNSKAKPKKLRD